MYRVASLIVAGAAVAAALAVYAQPPANPGDDPPLLKKKGAPDIDDKGLNPPADDADKDKKPDAPKPNGDKPAEKGKPRPDPDEVLNGVAKSLHSAEEQLAKKEVTDSTRQAQEDALKGLDSLIDLAENPPDDQGDDGKQADQNNKDNKDNKDNKQGNQGDKPNNKDNKTGNQGDKPGNQNGKPDASRMPGSKSGQSSGSSRTRPGGRRKATHPKNDGGMKPEGGGQSQPGGQQQGDPAQPMGQNKPSADKNPMGGNGGGNNTNPPDPKDPNADLYKDPWGHLPETMRAKMNAFPNTKDFMPEYEALISKYYSKAIAEQGRRRGTEVMWTPPVNSSRGACWACSAWAASAWRCPPRRAATTPTRRRCPTAPPPRA